MVVGVVVERRCTSGRVVLISDGNDDERGGVRGSEGECIGVRWSGRECGDAICISDIL